MRKLLVALMSLVPLSIWAQTGPGGGTGPLFDPGSGGGGGGDLTLCSETSGDFDCPGTGSFADVTTADVDGENGLTLFGNPGGDFDTAPTGDNVTLFTKADGAIYIKRPGDGVGESYPLGGSWAYFKLGPVATRMQFVENDNTPWDLTQMTSVESSDSSIAYQPALFCSTATNIGLPCAVDGDCTGGGVCEEWGAIRLSAAKTYYVRMDLSYGLDDNSGRYTTCAGGTNSGQTCRIDADCPSSTCTGETGAVATTECALIDVLQHSTGNPPAGATTQPAVVAPIGQKFQATATTNRAQFPFGRGNWVIPVSSPPIDIYFKATKCNAAQTNVLDFEVLAGHSSVMIQEMP